MGTVYLATMPHSYGYRARTRKLFARDFRQHGMPALKTNLTNYKVGDLEDIKANSAIHKGMPFKFYHGRTGRVFNVTRRALGIVVTKTNGNKVLESALPCASSTCARPTRSKIS